MRIRCPFCKQPDFTMLSLKTHYQQGACPEYTQEDTTMMTPTEQQLQKQTDEIRHLRHIIHEFQIETHRYRMFTSWIDHIKNVFTTKYRLGD